MGQQVTSVRRKLFVGIVLVAVIATGIAGSAGAHSARTSSGSSNGKGTPIKIGVICSCSGTFGAAFGAGRDAFVAWSKTVNKAGGIQGHPVEVIIEDDGGEPGKGVSAANDLLSEDVVALVDLSLVSGSWNDLLQKAKIPTIAGPTAVQNPYTFWVGQTTVGAPSAQQATATVAKQSGAKRLGQIYCAETTACTDGATRIKEAAEKQGLKVVYQASFSSSAPNYTSQCLAAKDAKVDALIVGSQPSTISRVAEDCDRQDFHPVYQIGVIQWSPAMLKQPGLKDGTWGSASNYPFFDETQPEIKRMRNAIKAYFPDVLSADNKDTPGQLLVSMWAGGVLLERATAAAGITKSGRLTREKVYDSLYKLKGETLNGLAAPITYKRGTNNTIDCWFTAHFQGGKYFVDNKGKASCASSN